jgi:AraC-like DNA-binding protein
MDYINIINVISILSSIIFAGLILIYKKKSSKIFSVFLINICFVLGYFLLLDKELNDIGIILLPVFMGVVITLGPVLWIYVKKVTGDNKTEKLFRVFIIPTIFIIILIVLLILSRVLYIENEYLLIFSQYYVVFGLTVFFLAQNIYYIAKCFKLYKSHQITISNSYSYTEKINLSWLRILILGYILFILGLVLAHIVNDELSFYIFYVTILIYIIFSGYQALNQQPVKKIVISAKEKIQSKININNAFFKELLNQLIKKLENDKIYRDSNLTIQQLSDTLNTNNKYISTLINQEFEVNFVSFINKYRVEEAKQLLLNNNKKHLTIEGIGNESGFKSKSAFNAAFKKFTGLTPSEYIKKN